MVIWQMKASTEYLSLAYTNEQPDVRRVMDYEDGKLSTWEPIYVEYASDVYDDMDERYERVPNFPSISGNITCDEESKLILDELVHDHVEFLPLLSHTIKDRQLYILYPKTILDCLDNEQSEFVRTRTGYIRGISRHVFRSDCISDTPIFRLPIAGSPSSRPYVSDEFQQLIEDNNLTGLEFWKVWEG